MLESPSASQTERTDLIDEIEEFRPLLTVVIPTHNRFQYVTAAIQSILNNPSLDIELVVNDTSSSPDLEQWVASHVQDPRFRYRHSETPLSMTENYNAALELATGEYVCVIGDDDSVNPEILDAVRWAKTEGIDALTPLISASYGWPDFVSRFYGKAHAGKLYIHPFSGKARYPDVEEEMARCVSNAGQGTFNLPKVYHGIVRRSCLEEVRRRTGAFFKSISPDVYGALTVSNFIKKYCLLDYPLVLPGSSGGSNAGRSAMGRHKGSLRDDPHIKPFKDLVWPGVVPEFFSVQTVWGVAAVEALQAMDRTDLLKRYNVSLLHAICSVSHSDYLAQTVRNLPLAWKLTGRHPVRGGAEYGLSVMKVLGQRVRTIASRVFNPKANAGAIEFSGLATVEDAIDNLTAHLQSNPYSFQSIIKKVDRLP